MDLLLKMGTVVPVLQDSLVSNPSSLAQGGLFYLCWFETQLYFYLL